MIINEEIRNAIKQAVEISGNPYRLSKIIPGVRHTTIRDWLSGKTKSISDENWDKVREAVGNLFNEAGLPRPWAMAYDLNPYDHGPLGYPWRDDSLNESMHGLSELERKRLYICLSNVCTYKSQHQAAKVEFSFSAEVKDATDPKCVGHMIDDDEMIPHP